MARHRRHRSRPRRRRGRFSGLYKLLSVLLVTAAVIGACMVFFRVNQVTVTGNARYTAEEVSAASGIEIGDNLIALPRSRIAARIRVGLPYIKSVSITPALPDTVVLHVTEHAAAAAVAGEGTGWWLISDNGKLLEQTAGIQGVITVTGLTALGPVLGDLLTVEEHLENRKQCVLSLLEVLEERGLMGDCTEIDCTEPGQLILYYLNFQIKMPTSDDFEYVFNMLDGAFASGRVSREESGCFDFTVADGKAYYSRSE